jgi:hypothetical protein
MCDNCLIEPWSQSTWDKLEAGQERFVYNISIDQLENGAKARCWWCCVALDTVPHSDHQSSVPVLIEVDLRFHAPIHVEPLKFSTVNLALERQDDESGAYEVRQLGISAKRRKYVIMARSIALT